MKNSYFREENHKIIYMNPVVFILQKGEVLQDVLLTPFYSDKLK